MYFRYPINDNHVHLFDPAQMDECLAMIDWCGYSHWNFLSYTMLPVPGSIADNLLAALVKIKERGRCRAFASFDYNRDYSLPSAENLLDQITFFDAAGFDGIKMMDGKPGIRVRQGEPLDSSKYDLMFNYAERTQLPIVYHINDPVEFWNWDQMPEWAHRENVYYGGGSFPHKYTIDEEALGFLRKHPHLNIVLPHFFFMSDQPALCVELFDRYPNLYFDITPGWEMFENFGKTPEYWRPFFIRHSNKILYGTDTFSDPWEKTVTSLRRVLETGDRFTAFEEDCRGLSLPEEALEDIYFNNYHKFVRNMEKPINVKMVLEYADTVNDRIPKDENGSRNIQIVDYLKKELERYL